MYTYPNSSHSWWSIIVLFSYITYGQARSLGLRVINGLWEAPELVIQEKNNLSLWLNFKYSTFSREPVTHFNIKSDINGIFWEKYRWPLNCCSNYVIKNNNIISKRHKLHISLLTEILKCFVCPSAAVFVWLRCVVLIGIKPSLLLTLGRFLLEFMESVLTFYKVTTCELLLA